MLLKLRPVVLAGGTGSRLWPLSQKHRPKQFIKGKSGFSSFQLTLIRNRNSGTPLVIANLAHEQIVNDQLNELDLKAELIFEPMVKNTAIAAVLASLYSAKSGYDLISLIPSDHLIEDQLAYEICFHNASRAAAEFRLSTIGVVATKPKSDLGYIKLKQYLGNNVFLSSKFIEKPNKFLAEEFIKTGGYFWNTGIYFLRVDYLNNLAAAHTPQLFKNLSYWIENVEPKTKVVVANDVYKDLWANSFDYSFSEKLEQFAVLRAGFKWQDLGNWENMIRFIDDTSSSLAS